MSNVVNLSVVKNDESRGVEIINEKGPRPSHFSSKKWRSWRKIKHMPYPDPIAVYLGSDIPPMPFMDLIDLWKIEKLIKDNKSKRLSYNDFIGDSTFGKKEAFKRLNRLRKIGVITKKLSGDKFEINIIPKKVKMGNGGDLRMYQDISKEKIEELIELTNKGGIITAEAIDR